MTLFDNSVLMTPMVVDMPLAWLLGHSDISAVGEETELLRAHVLSTAPVGQNGFCTV